MVDHSEIPCSHCDSDQTELIAFYEDEQSQIMALQKEVDHLIEVVDDLLDRMGYNEDNVAKAKGDILH
jgi:hypothetical protein